ncbi:MAG: ATP-dependent DNA helicase [Armatimonadetes bacterium]|nr:ATP-dependent DNA helicase [Armatimonadota bacterium]
MPTAHQLIAEAFRRLTEKPGMQVREGQQQLSQLIGDCIDAKVHGAFEAPTGLGKSFAALIPAIAYALAENKRVVIATYTNVLTEQYWHKDLPFALSLFDETPSTQLLIGRQRYACLAAVEQMDRNLMSTLIEDEPLGIESQLRQRLHLKQKEFGQKWKQIATPAACPGRHCHHYNDCFYYRARKGSLSSNLVITNHSVVIQDALLRQVTEGDITMLGNYDFLVLDEAHDFHSAAQNGMEFEITENKLRQYVGLTQRIHDELLNIATKAGWGTHWTRALQKLHEVFDWAVNELSVLYTSMGRSAVVAVSPPELKELLTRITMPEEDKRAQFIADTLAEHLERFTNAAKKILGPANDAVSIPVRESAQEQVQNYLRYLEDFQAGAKLFSFPIGTSISYLGGYAASPILRTDIVDLAEPLVDLLWSKTPTVCMSATLAVDNEFDFLKQTIGFQPEFKDILPSPFDFPSNMAAYVPKAGRVPDPTIARQNEAEDEYFDCIARELEQIILILQGRTLALFHSRREMEAVNMRINLPSHLPIHTQAIGSVSSLGVKFKKNPEASMFGLRSFWTGFDAPGNTLSCVVVVRVPFEVPIEPLQVARQAFMSMQGRDGFAEWTIPSAKMLVRQGVGRLVRNDVDRGLVVLLDPRLRSKPYGESFLLNLPDGVRVFDDAADALGFLSLDYLTVND